MPLWVFTLVSLMAFLSLSTHRLQGLRPPPALVILFAWTLSVSLFMFLYRILNPFLIG